MLSFLPGISIKFERNAFKVETEIEESFGNLTYFGRYVRLPSIFNSNPKSRRTGMAQCYAG
jgi:hypothetical protein